MATEKMNACARPPQFTILAFGDAEKDAYAIANAIQKEPDVDIVCLVFHTTGEYLWHFEPCWDPRWPSQGHFIRHDTSDSVVREVKRGVPRALLVIASKKCIENPSVLEHIRSALSANPGIRNCLFTESMSDVLGSKFKDLRLRLALVVTRDGGPNTGNVSAFPHAVVRTIPSGPISEKTGKEIWVEVKNLPYFHQ